MSEQERLTHNWSHQKSVGKGWAEIEAKVIMAANYFGIVIDQIKEKFGNLRVYFHGPEDMYDIFNMMLEGAESQARRYCEYCGARDQESNPVYNAAQSTRATTTGYWLKTLCHTCHLERDKKTQGRT